MRIPTKRFLYYLLITFLPTACHALTIGIFTETYKPLVGGTEKSIEARKKILTARGHKVYVITPTVGTYQDNDATIIRLPSQAIPGDFQHGHMVNMLHYTDLKKIFHQVKECALDIISVDTCSPTGHLGLLWAKKLHIPAVYFYHTFLASLLSHDSLIDAAKNKLLLHYTNQLFSNKVDHVIVPTASIKKYLTSHYSINTPISVAPTGSDLSVFNAAKNKALKATMRAKLGIAAHEKVLIYVGRIEYEKNIEFLVDAAALLKKKYLHPFKLLIVGDGSTRKKLEKSARQKLGDSVLFTGEIQFTEVPKYYAAADIFVFSSRGETQGIVLTEAMAAGLPVVAVKAMGVKDVVLNGSSGYLTKNILDDFVAKLLLLLKDPLLYNTMSRAAQEHAQNFSQERMGQQLEKIYTKVVHEYRQQRTTVSA